jgi:UDP-N-acetylglucosamine--N-acetylmuramyl-(pentapeptide) pyrophosphoryl-undecaprenol N-acetylglucosamine transferase
MALAQRELSALRLLITGGGTGGHLFPAVAAAQALRERQPESEVLFVGTRRKIDTTSLDRYGFASSSIHSYGLKGKNITELLKALAVLPISFLEAVSIIRKFKPDVALGVGGYVTGPVMLAARVLGVPTIIHEQNSVPGLANRKLGKIVDQICISLPGSEKFFPQQKVLFTGNPVRKDILELAAVTREDAHATPLTLLVLGGSQGAHGLNRLVTEALCDLDGKPLSALSVIHQTGNADAGWVEEKYRNAGIKARVAPFFQDMKEVYQEADVLVSRAGATTLTELSVLGKPAILVPYPYAADNHQQKNAAYYVQGEGAMQFNEAELTAKNLATALSALDDDREHLKKMAVAMRGMARPDAAEKIIDICIRAAGHQGGDRCSKDSRPGGCADV